MQTVGPLGSLLNLQKFEKRFRHFAQGRTGQMGRTVGVKQDADENREASLDDERITFLSKDIKTEKNI